jgi:transcriptional regulator with PAS, ATPase and Fis domain
MESLAQRPVSGALELVAFWQDEMRVFPLPVEGHVTIGRADDSGVRIDHPSVSRYHAILHLGGDPTIEDLGGINGTFVSGERRLSTADTVGLRQLSRESARLAVGESATLGGVSIVLRRAASDARATLDISREGPEQVICDPRTQAIYEQAELAAQSPIAVMLLGETGVGKEVLARAIHTRSPRASQPFMGINCAALTGTLLESELFGYEKGAFTGAAQSRPGLFEAANGGTVFLDELGELPRETQAKLLRLIEERMVLRLGGRTARPVDVRFISATNRDLEAELGGSGFRADLYYRLNGISLEIPPLRQRPADVEPLARMFLIEASRQLDRGRTPELSDEALVALCAHAWPGNVRELRNVIQRAVVLCRQGPIERQHLPESLGARTSLPRSQPPVPDGAKPLQSVREDVRDLERRRIVDALGRCRGNQTAAAKMLGISRRTLVSRLSDFDLPRPRKRFPSSD